jgi:hypothetical protein
MDHEIISFLKGVALFLWAPISLFLGYYHMRLVKVEDRLQKTHTRDEVEKEINKAIRPIYDKLEEVNGDVKFLIQLQLRSNGNKE